MKLLAQATLAALVIVSAVAVIVEGVGHSKRRYGQDEYIGEWDVDWSSWPVTFKRKK